MRQANTHLTWKGAWRALGRGEEGKAGERWREDQKWELAIVVQKDNELLCFGVVRRNNASEAVFPKESMESSYHHLAANAGQREEGARGHIPGVVRRGGGGRWLPPEAGARVGPGRGKEGELPSQMPGGNTSNREYAR